MEWIWLGVIVSLILIELVSINFTAIWFVFSGIVSYVLLKCNQDYIVQVLVFLILGGIFIVIIRPIVISGLLDKRDKIVNSLTEKYPFFNKLIPAEIRSEKKKNNSVKKNKKVKKGQKKNK